MATETEKLHRAHELMSRFLDHLEADGYPLGVDVHLQLRELFSRFDLQNLSDDQIKRLVTPVLARNPQDQAQIYRLFDRATDEMLPPPSINTNSTTPSPVQLAKDLKEKSNFWTTIQTYLNWENIWKQRWYWLPILMLGTAFGAYQWLNPTNTTPINTQEQKTKNYYNIHVGLNDTTTTLPYATSIPDLKSIEKIDPTRQNQFILDTIVGLNYRYRGIYESKNNADTVGLRLCLNSGLCDTFYNVFIVKKRLERRQGDRVLPFPYQNRDRNLDEMTPQKMPAWGWKHRFLSWEKVWAMTMLYLLGLFFSLQYRRYLRKMVEEEKQIFDKKKRDEAQKHNLTQQANKTYVLERTEGARPPYAWNLHLDAVPKLGIPPNLQQVAQQLRTRSEGEIRIFEAQKTIKKSIRQPENMDFVYSKKTEPNEFLVLIDLPHPQAHRARLLDWMVGTWQRNEIYIDRFFFNGDIRLAWNEKNPRGLTLQDLQLRYPKHRLLIFGNAFQLLAPATGQLAKWTTIFELWHRRAIISPRVPAEWDRRERALAEKFLIATQSAEGLNWATQQLDMLAELLPAQRMGVQLSSYFTTLELDKLVQSTQQLTGGGDFLAVLKQHFQRYENQKIDDRLLQWLAACAVYPKLEWDWTLRIGEVVQTANADNFEVDEIVNVQNILQLARLSWFETGTMPDQVRQFLLEWLTQNHPETLVRVREALQNIMRQNPPPAQSVAHEEFEMTLVLNELLLKPESERREMLQNDLNQWATQTVPSDFVTLSVLERAQTELDVVVPAFWLDLLNAAKGQISVDFGEIVDDLSKENLGKRIQKYLEIAQQIGDTKSIEQLQSLANQLQQLENAPPPEPELAALLRNIEIALEQSHLPRARTDMRLLAERLGNKEILDDLISLENRSARRK